MQEYLELEAKKQADGKLGENKGYYPLNYPLNYPLKLKCK
jgi:hypothetical protein